MRGLDPTDKSARLANYLVTLRKEILQLCHAVAVEHPALLTPDMFEILGENYQTLSPDECFYLEGIPTRPSQEDCQKVIELMG